MLGVRGLIPVAESECDRYQARTLCPYFSGEAEAPTTAKCWDSKNCATGERTASDMGLLRCRGGGEVEVVVEGVAVFY